MCGITGIYSKQGLDSYLSCFKKATDVATHRGPDGWGTVLIDVPHGKSFLQTDNSSSVLSDAAINRCALGLGHRRLAILDLSPAGAQPMTDNNESSWIVHNGEVYNYLELRRDLEKAGHEFRSQTDTEVILHAYREWGSDCVRRFRGIWAFAVVDLENQLLFCSRDRFGVKPFHYHFDGNRFVFASEIKQLLEYPFVPRIVNDHMVFEYLAYSAVDYGENTFFRHINKLPHGHNLVFDMRNMRLQVTPYYRPAFTIDNRISLKDASVEFKRLLTESVRLQLRSDVEVGTCLSGGLDSSSLVCLMQNELKVLPQQTVQHTFSAHFEEEEANELEYMNEVISSLDVTPHFIYPTPEQLLEDIERMVWHHEEPFHSSSNFSEWSVYKLVHQNHTKVMLDGQGPDEMLAGYNGFAPSFFKQLESNRNCRALLRETWKYSRFQRAYWPDLVPEPFSKMLRRLLPSPDNAHAYPPIRWIAPGLYDTYKNIFAYQQASDITHFDQTEYLNNALYQATFVNSLQANLKTGDRSSMAFSVESRVPFLDHSLVDFVFSLPAEYKIHNGYTKFVMREAMRGILPERIRLRTRKLGYTTPEATWQRNQLKPLIDRALSDERMHRFIRPDEASKYLAEVHTNGLLDFSPWRWINLFLWLRTFGLS